jgi:hypothetical protein
MGRQEAPSGRGEFHYPGGTELDVRPPAITCVRDGESRRALVVK